MTDSSADASMQFKNRTREGWNKAAAGWDQQTPQIHQWLLDITEAMMDASGIKEGAQVLDVAAGAGDQTLMLARRVGAQGHVLATDLSADILQLALRNAQQAGLPQVEVQVADAEQLEFPAGSFDAAVSRLGVMFCPHPLLALQGMHRVLKPGGKAAVVVFSEPRANPAMGILMSTAVKHAGLPPRDPYQPGGLMSLGKPGLLASLFAEAGFKDVRVQKIPAPFRLPTTQDYMEFAQTAASPIMQLVSTLDPQTQQKAWVDMAAQLEVFQTPDGWEGPNELLLASGTH
ncbi:class I SAM-dependent methyltransferase [Deinococcus roseus]|uniref:Methyltransferase n=1 Tax=Deinococcus roseus TaxID=392414 RepID=A0ABQ2D2G0_9DEIO|nr:class I SAM-dependent methyltransferase [Deinococcus roseus]GGJ40213.1 methyltransferase [Deinococcus roseus]